MSPDQRIADFEPERLRLKRLAYRMLGSLSEADDVVQDAWIRWAGVQEGVDVPGAYLTRIVTRLCLDRLKSARARRETYIGPWLPEPLLNSADPYDDIADDVTVTLMLAMERLSPLERAAFLLHDVFDVPLTEVAMTLDRDPAAVRQLASRARKNVRKERVRYRLDASEADSIARAFFTAARDGDTTALANMLADDVEIHADGGGKVMAFRNIVRGITNVLKLFANVRRKNLPPQTLVQTAVIDGMPGYISRYPDDSLGTTALDVAAGRIRAIYVVRNPEKLRRLAEGH
ncbi:sigma-70 family RNA polymerase sigma factor [Caulobacter sp. CCNWLY153]|uniref:RNA polymerase sigma factor SigJ n=1 Tax=Caulobacter radicis TaxID=2172650 RepID=A0A2T9JIL1_9CAUL|nr:sigma-70 family RNA polymerase sigma factor [Caulobacter radicis]PVM79411.1 RNA polymerase sigma factor SigJ [Caulobacter radicis]PVM83530.1 RNA polymerase sigma factor SigJ [Caulobacter radicis]